MAFEKDNPFGETEEERKLAERWIRYGEKHQEPSPKTLEYINNMADKIDKLKDDLTKEIQLLGLKIADQTMSIFDKADCRYATKKVEDEIKTIKDTQEKRTYDWLRYAIITGITVAISIYLSKK